MKIIKYSPDAIEKIQEIERRVRREFGSKIAEKVKRAITDINIYNEREDYMYKLFGISSLDEEAENYWDDIERDNNQ